ncbi:GNAT family N-acetyltransferase [Nakamurella leprariae]|uniref:GNAT family N-acetyltransferase n=1 Tax=Nakamurella leprariae TaxID=2803911 RepID=A0A938YDK8_9ACTN|nr:GNAT family N-acetyltransferase [Nakamurella leprariae]MBM9468737.1 GNAT family N-acetyltransferase [Nakamurella leprariae]
MEPQVRVHQTVESVADLASEWQVLHDDAGDVNPFSGPDWAVTWLEHFADDRRAPFVLSVRYGDRLVGVLPLYRQSAARVIDVLQPVGTGSPWIGPYELPAMTADPARGRAVARAVVAELCARPDDWDWSSVIFGSAAPWLEPEWLPNWEFTVVPRRTIATVTLDLAGGHDIYSGRRNLKESFRRARNRLTRDLGTDGWSTRRVLDEDEIGAAFDRLVRLHGSRADVQDGRPVHANVLADDRVQRYLREVVTRMSRRGAVSVYELLIADEVVAGQLMLHTSTATYSSVSGATDAAWPYSAITYLQSLAVADAQQAGHRQLCLSAGPNQAKLRWTDRVDLTPEFGIIGPRRRSRMLSVAATARGTVTSFVAARRAHRAEVMERRK